MPIALTNVFGSEIRLAVQPRTMVRQFSGFPGAHGLTAMSMGTRGYALQVSGTLRAASRVLLEVAVRLIERYLWYGADAYSFAGSTYAYVVWSDFEVLTDSAGKSVHYTSEGWYVCRFVMKGRSLL